MAKLIGKTYAQALFEVAEEVDKIQQFKEELNSIYKIFDKEREFKIIFEHPKLSKDEKKDIINSVFKGKVAQEILNLIYIVIDKGRERYLMDIIEEYIRLSNEKQGIIEAQAITAVPLNEEEKLKLQNKLSEKLGKNVILKNIVDTDIIGGVLVKIQDKIIDASIKGQLDKIQKSLKDIRVTKIGVSKE
ncbi:F0F1 ATP synthase subunit delta [Caloranaerobacter azorensis]|uniref:ATP synthase subunit delta n=2 Tax=Caloranaerobacter azorensis TaxID=116090 RepID=A0A096CVV0_9FIRM|nr:F0F1 ATP synthase subunit delta [Caloranaerobacter azorensis]KGG80674.1 ATP synthase subunit delta [Caloranaerobacter azorensis H53214]QIB27654.1 F0F1 ATP synthase subunit delta [Caloranaerobacter azorensis]